MIKLSVLSFIPDPKNCTWGLIGGDSKVVKVRTSYNKEEENGKLRKDHSFPDQQEKTVHYSLNV